MNNNIILCGCYLNKEVCDLSTPLCQTLTAKNKNLQFKNKSRKLLAQVKNI